MIDPRWQELRDSTGSMKRVIDTRLCARRDAVKAVKTNFVELPHVLEVLISSLDSERTQAQAAAHHEGIH